MISNSTYLKEKYVHICGAPVSYFSFSHPSPSSAIHNNKDNVISNLISMLLYKHMYVTIVLPTLKKWISMQDFFVLAQHVTYHDFIHT